MAKAKRAPEADVDRFLPKDGRLLDRSSVELACVLTDHEHVGKSRELAAILGEEQDHEAEAEEVKAGIKQRGAELKKRKLSLAGEVRSGTELRHVPTITVTSPEEGLAITIRTDTGERVNSRPLTEDERQLPLPGTAEV